MMPKDTVIQTKKWYRNGYLTGTAVGLGIAVACTAAITYLLFDNDGVLFLYLLCLPAVLLTLFMAGLMVYMSAFYRKFRIIFGTSGISVETIYHPILHPYTCAYEDIQRISRGDSAASIRILDARGNSYQLPCGALEDGMDGVLSEFKNRIPHEKIEPKIQTAAQRVSCRSRASIAFSVFFFCFLTTMLIFIPTEKFPFFSIAWKITDWSFNRSSVNAVRIDSQGHPWLIVKDNLDLNHYHLRHVTGNGAKSWKMPALGSITPFMIGLAEDANQDPWLIMGKQLAHWEGGQWTFLDTPMGAQLWGTSAMGLAVADSIVWGIDQSARDRIIRLDLSQPPGKVDVFPLPISSASADCQIGGIKLLPGGDLMAIFHNDSVLGVFRLHDSQWQEIASIQKDISSETCVSDFTVDSNGNIWVLSFSVVENKNVGKFDPQRNAWTWMDIRHPGLDSEIGPFEFGYSNIIVDPLGRVWISGDRERGRIDYGMVGVYEKGAEDTLVEIRHYTTENSSLESGVIHHILPTPDGRIWSWGGQLVWIQSAAEALPATAPDWIISLGGREERSLVAFCILAPVCILALVYVILAVINTRKAGRISGR